MNTSAKSFKFVRACVAVLVTMGLGGATAYAQQPADTTSVKAVPLADNTVGAVNANKYMSQAINLYSPPWEGSSAQAIYPEGVLQSIGALNLRGGKISCREGMIKVPLRLGTDMAPSHMTFDRHVVVNKVTSMGWYIEAPDGQLGLLTQVLVVNNNSAVEVPVESGNGPSSSFMLRSEDWGKVTSVFACTNLP